MVELHMHLDGSLPLSVVEELMLLNYSSLNDELKALVAKQEDLKAKLQVPVDCKSLKEYLECFKLPLGILQNTASIKTAVKGLLEELKSEGIKYVEIRFAPQLHSQAYYLFDEKMIHETEVVRTAIDAANEVQGIKCNFILCMMRNGNIEDNLRTLQIAKAFYKRGVVAVDLAGNEGAIPTSKFRKEFKLAREMGLPFTIHAGEAGAIESRVKSLYDAIEFGANRIGHGIALVAAPELMQVCKERGIGIECCPTSNLQTLAVSDLSDHPIYDFLNEGLMVSVNTDNRTVSGTSLSREFEILQLDEDFKGLLIQNAIDMAFLSEEEKKELFPEWV